MTNYYDKDNSNDDQLLQQRKLQRRKKNKYKKVAMPNNGDKDNYNDKENACSKDNATTMTRNKRATTMTEIVRRTVTLTIIHPKRSMPQCMSSGNAVGKQNIKVFRKKDGIKVRIGL